MTTTTTDCPVTWVKLEEVLERKLAPSTTKAGLVRRIERLNKSLPAGHRSRIRRCRGCVVLQDIIAAPWNKK